MSMEDGFSWINHLNGTQTVTKTVEEIKNHRDFASLWNAPPAPRRRSHRQDKRQEFQILPRTRRPTTTSTTARPTTGRNTVATSVRPEDRVKLVVEFMEHVHGLYSGKKSSTIPEKLSLSDRKTLTDLNHRVNLNLIINGFIQGVLGSNTSSYSRIRHILIEDPKLVNDFDFTQLTFTTVRDAVIVNAVLFYSEFVRSEINRHNPSIILRDKQLPQDIIQRALAILREYALIPMSSIILKNNQYAVPEVAQEFAKKIHQQLITHLKKLPDERERIGGERVVTKVESLTTTLGYEKWLVTADLVQRFPQFNHALAGDSLLALIRLMIQSKLKRMVSRISSNDPLELYKEEYFAATRTSSLYIRELNHLYIPPAYFGPPFYAFDGINVINYGALGVELMTNYLRSIDLQSIMFDSSGARIGTAENAASFKEYVDLAKKVHELHKSQGDIDENISRYTALRVAHEAYFTGDQGVTLLTNFEASPEQLFFFAFANTLCAHSRDQTKNRLRKIMIDSPALNFPGFNSAFNCTADATDVNITIW